MLAAETNQLKIFSAMIAVFLWESYEAHKYIVWEKCAVSLNVHFWHLQYRLTAFKGLNIELAHDKYVRSVDPYGMDSQLWHVITLLSNSLRMQVACSMEA